MNGKIRLERQPLELQASVQNVLATLQSAGSIAGQRIELHAVPVWIHGDQTRFEQILTNLLVNAATHTPAGGTIRVLLDGRDGEAVLEVADDGSGIEPHEQAQIFEPFYQSPASRERASGGLGIGLTLVKRLAELHGGSVAVHSAGSGRGSTFTVRLPAILTRPVEVNELAASISRAVS
jgi:signal transduction histidine kinase